MSWSVYYVGTPAKLIEQLDAYGEQMTGVSKDEFLNALPHMKSLIIQNYDRSVELGIAQGDPKETFVRIDAHGSGWHKDGQQVSSSLTCSIKAVSKFEAEGK